MHDFTILVLPGTYAASVAITLDVLSAAVAMATRANVACPKWRVVSPSGGLVPLSSGLHIETSPIPRRNRGDRSTWIVPGLGVQRGSEVAMRLQSDEAKSAIRALKAHGRSGGPVAASCTGVFLLQAADLLVGHRVTTSWWLAAELRQLESRCVVDADRMVCIDGSIATAGAALAQTDLMLHLLRARLGAALAEAVSRVMLIDGRQAQSPFILPTLLSSGNDLIARLTEKVHATFPGPVTVAFLADEFAMSTRTLSRHVKAATGKSTSALVQSIRLNHARMLIETSRMTIENVAEQVGYGDATALRRLMRKMAGVRPSRFRSSATGAR